MRGSGDAYDYYGRGAVYYKLENYKEAVRDITKAIELRDEEYAPDYYGRGKAYVGLDKFANVLLFICHKGGPNRDRPPLPPQRQLL
jgi:tetratricopeptide (TPR) repeat protein